MQTYGKITKEPCTQAGDSPQNCMRVDGGYGVRWLAASTRLLIREYQLEDAENESLD
jgi:hypothetical protein